MNRKELSEFTHDPERVRAFVLAVRAILIDADNAWIEDVNGADAVQDLTMALDAAGLGADENGGD